MIDWLGPSLGGALWEALPLLAFGPLGAGLWLLLRFSRVSAEVLLFLGAVGAVLIFLWAYDRQQDRIEFLEAEREKLIDATQIQERAIDELQSVIVNWRERYEELQAALKRQDALAAEAEAEMKRLRDELRSDRLGERAQTDPDAAADTAGRRVFDGMRRLRCASETSPDKNDC